MRAQLQNIYLIDVAIGLLSSIVDNVPLVAASMGMYEVVETSANLSAWDSMFVQDGKFWQFLAYCAGTGGSALIIGSAAGVAVMGLEKIDFIWYLKRISLIVLLDTSLEQEFMFSCSRKITRLFELIKFYNTWVCQKNEALIRRT